MISIIEYFKNASPGDFAIGIIIAAIVIKIVINILRDE